MNMGGPCPDYTYRTTDVDPKGTLSHLRLSRHEPLRRDRPAELRAAGPRGADLGRSGPARPRRADARRRNGAFSVILASQRPIGHDGRLVGAPADDGAAADAAMCGRLDRGARRARRDRAARRRAADDRRGDRSAHRESRPVGGGHGALRHRPGPLVPRAPRHQRADALEEDREHRRHAQPGLLRRRL